MALLVAFSWPPRSSAQTRATAADASEAASCSVSGTVVKLAGSMPIKSATVTLESVDDHSRTSSARTDAGGRFELKGIDPGRYRLRVVRDGFVTMEYGQRTPSDPGAVMSLSFGQSMKDLLFRLLPSAVISGRIQNEEGEPLPWVRVSALRETYFRGRRRLISETTVATDDLGQYRLFGLRPGRYFIQAAYKPGQRLDSDDSDSTPESAKSGYVPTYYPGSIDKAKAVTIAVKTGEEISSMDFLLEPTTTYSIRGHVSILGIRSSTDGVIVMLVPRTNGREWTTPNRQSLVDKGDGGFALSDILPGAYTVSAMWMASDRRYQAQQSVDVASGDVEGLQLVLTPGWNVTGQIVWDQQKPSLEKGILDVFARSLNTGIAAGTQGRVNANGSFLLRELPEGTYQLTTAGQTQDCYLKSIRYAGMEVSGDEFNVIRGTQATLEVTLSARGAHLQGAVTDADGLPAAGVWVVLIPDGARRSEYHLFKQLTTDQYGRFAMRGIAPGDYRLFSWEQVERGAWEDPEFLKDFENQGQGVSLQEGDGQTLQLVAIRTASAAQEKP